MMEFNDKFLNVCFKVGKILFSILLVVTLLVSVVFLCKTVGKTLEANNVKVTYNYDAAEVIQRELYPNKEVVSSSTVKADKQISSKLDQEINAFAKEQELSEHMTKELIRGVRLIENNPDKFFSNFVKFHNLYVETAIKELAKKEKISEDTVKNYIKSNKNDITAEVYNQYLKMYDEEFETVEALKNDITTQRNIGFVSFLISLGVFILFLFLPILIRIEENTRK